MNRWAPFWIALVAGLGLTALLWQFGLYVFLFPLVLPVLFWPKGHHKVCPVCGHTTMHPAERYCPADGTRLETQ